MLALALTTGLISCSAFRSISSTTGRSIARTFASPAAVSEKIADPVRPDARLAALWIGHATVLLQIDDKFILTDPNLTGTTGMFAKRVIEPGMDPSRIPPLDAVVISHMHIDHLSYGSLDLIEGKTKQLLLPEGGLVYIPNYDFPMRELRRWEAWEKDGLRITAVPVRHPGWRYGLDDAWMKQSATGYVVEHDGITVYFGGDTGYDSTMFRETARRFPSIDVALLPIAPINPREYSKNRHADPLDALRIYRDLRARTMVPIHFDTYYEALDSLGEAPALLREAMIAQHLTPQEVRILKIGEQYVFIGKDPPSGTNP
jgi:N-acyl-phosphatidylethanolamine-hydrolysing phospholipase D